MNKPIMQSIVNIIVKVAIKGFLWGIMPDIVFMDMDGNEIRKDISDINSLDDVKKSFKELDKKRKDKKNGQI